MDINKELINVEDALKRVGGNMDLYKRLLNQFTGGDHINPLEEALSTGAFEDASRFAHTIKGVASNLSLIKLTAAAADLEQKIKNNLDHSDSMAALKQVYYETSQAIAEVI